MNILGVLAGLFIMIAYGIAIRELYNVKQATKEQMKFWLFITTALLFATANSVQVMLSTKVWGFFFIEIVNVTLAIVSWGMAYYYYAKGEDNE